VGEIIFLTSAERLMLHLGAFGGAKWTHVLGALVVCCCVLLCAVACRCCCCCCYASAKAEAQQLSVSLCTWCASLGRLFVSFVSAGSVWGGKFEKTLAPIHWKWFLLNSCHWILQLSARAPQIKTCSFLLARSLATKRPTKRDSPSSALRLGARFPIGRPSDSLALQGLK